MVRYCERYEELMAHWRKPNAWRRALEAGRSLYPEDFLTLRLVIILATFLALVVLAIKW